MKPPSPRPPYNLIRPILRYRGRAVAFFMVVVVLAAVGVTLSPKKYKSESKLLVRVGRENAALDPTATTGRIIALNESREMEINSIVEQISSRCVFEKTLDRLDPEASQAAPQAREQALERLAKSVAISSPRRSTVLTLSCRQASPEEAQRTLAALVDVYLDEHMRVNRTPGSYEFFASQSEQLKAQLDAAEASLRDRKNAFSFSSLDDRRKALEAQLSDVETQLRQVTAALAGSRAKLASLESGVKDLPQALASRLVAGVPNDGLAGMREELFRLRAREKELLSKCTPEHPQVVAIRLEVQEVEAALKNEEPGRDQTIAAVVAEETAGHDALMAQERSLAGQVSELRTRIAEFNRQEVAISALTREVKQLESRYLAYQADSEQARISRALQADRISNISIIQPASFEPMPVSPRRALVLALAVLLGGCGGIALCFLSEQAAPPTADDAEGSQQFHAPALEAASRAPIEPASNGEGRLAESRAGDGHAKSPLRPEG